MEAVVYSEALITTTRLRAVISKKRVIFSTSGSPENSFKIVTKFGDILSRTGLFVG
jgi:hypothetical protein